MGVNKPKVDEGDWVDFGPNGAVVSKVYNPKSVDDGDIEVVMIDEGGKASCGDLAWVEDAWEWATTDYGGYPEKDFRLQEYLEKARRGRY